MTTIELSKPKRWAFQLDFPTSWDELTPAELEAIAAILLNEGSRQQMLLQLIAGRARMQGVRLPKDWRILLDPEQATIDGLPLVDALLAENNRSIVPYPMLGSWYGPDSDFNDLTVGEFEDAEAICSMYLSSNNDPQYLAMLAAALWRPLDSRRKRCTYTGYKAPVASFSRKLKPVNLQAIYLWFLGCRSRLPGLFPDVFGGSGQGDSTEGDITGFTKLIHNAAGPQNGTREMVRATLVKELLFDCQLKLEQAAEMERQMKK